MLADSALAFASSSHNQRTVAQHCQITYLAPGRLGMRLVAEARERHRGDRSGIYDVTVRSQAGEAIAEFRGHTRLIPGTLVPENREYFALVIIVCMACPNSWKMVSTS